MAPLVLHNVPDDELYIGKDGVTRPFAVVGAADERRSARLRRQATATHGSFGRTRSRQRAGSVGPGGGRGKQQQGKAAATTTSMVADEMFGEWKKTQEELHHQQHHSPHHSADAQQQLQDDLLDVRGGSAAGDRPSAGARKVSGGSIGANHPDDGNNTQSSTAASQQQQQQQQPFLQMSQNQPTEVILRGYRSADYQYAALHHYEQIAGRICEDYPRDPPVGSRRYRSSLRDAAARSAATIESNGRSALTPAERQAVMQRAASGQHWVKVTFESAQAADAALYASPQRILGYLVSAELYRGAPLSATEDVAVPDPDAMVEYERAAHGGSHNGFSATSSHTIDSGTVTQEDPFSGSSRQAATTATRSSAGSSSATVSGMDFTGAGSSSGNSRRQPWGAGGSAGMDVDGADSQDAAPSPSQPAAGNQDNEFCRRIPTARRATLKSPELALLPRESAVRRFVKRLPLLHRLTGTIIGNQVPRRENGLFDWEKASLYWKLIWWLDNLFKLFSGEILDASKDE